MKTKKFLAIILCICMMFALAGCESAEEKEAGAKATADGFFNALFNFDIPAAAEFTVESDEFATKFEEVNIDFFRESFNSGLGEMDVYADKISPVFDTVLEGIKSSFGYTITETASEKDKFVFSGTVSYIDFDALSDSDNIIGPDDITDDVMAEIFDEITASELYNDQMSQEELMNLMIEVLAEKVKPIITENMSDVDVLTQDFEIVVERPEDTWLVNYSESSLGDFMLSFDDITE